MILKQISHDRLAFQRQMVEYQGHLTSQYKDRVEYWASRSRSRSLELTAEGLEPITMIMDAIDHSKMRVPRSKALISKDFASFNRPSLDCHACLMHGRFALLALSEQHTMKDSNWCCDLISYCLHKAADVRNGDLRRCEFLCQCDNTTREVKNNSVLRLLGLYTGAHKLGRAEIRSLRTGHSHEDVDRWFSEITYLIERHTELHDPADFVSALQSFLDEPSTRPHEPVKEVRKVDQVRHWSLGCRAPPLGKRLSQANIELAKRGRTG